jgi:hypothetical protein
MTMCLGLEMGWGGRVVREGMGREEFNGGKRGG